MTENRGYLYTLGESEIFVSNRPKDYLSYTADAFLSVTDTFVDLSPHNLVWFPWNEARTPIPEMYYACNRVLFHWVVKQRLNKIRFFCDGGTHRSVTAFGAFLLTYYGKEAEAIVGNRRAMGSDDVDDHSWANPLLYIQTYLKEFPEDLLLFKAMREDPLGRLDRHTKTICTSIEARYGERKF